MHKHFYFILLDLIFNLWETILLEWERRNILDDNGKVLICPSKLRKKPAVHWLSNLKEKWFKKLTRRLIVRIMTIHDHFAKRGGGGVRRLDLKSCTNSQNSWRRHGHDSKWNYDSFWIFETISQQQLEAKSWWILTWKESQTQVQSYVLLNWHSNEWWHWFGGYGCKARISWINCSYVVVTYVWWPQGKD